MSKSNTSKGIKFVLYLGVVNTGKVDLRHLSKSIARTKLPVKSKYKNESIEGIKEWR